MSLYLLFAGYASTELVLRYVQQFCCGRRVLEVGGGADITRNGGERFIDGADKLAVEEREEPYFVIRRGACKSIAIRGSFDSCRGDLVLGKIDEIGGEFGAKFEFGHIG